MWHIGVLQIDTRMIPNVRGKFVNMRERVGKKIKKKIETYTHEYFSKSAYRKLIHVRKIYA